MVCCQEKYVYMSGLAVIRDDVFGFGINTLF